MPIFFMLSLYMICHTQKVKLRFTTKSTFFRASDAPYHKCYIYFDIWLTSFLYLKGYYIIQTGWVNIKLKIGASIVELKPTCKSKKTKFNFSFIYLKY